LKRICVFLCAAAFALLLGACRSTPNPAIPTTIPPTASSMPIDVPVAYTESDHCLSCHSDKQQLIDTAKPEEVVEKESTGAG